MDKIASGPSLLHKKATAQKVFGLNLSLRNGKIDFTPQKQWVALSATLKFDTKMSSCCEMEPLIGIEPMTYSLPWSCSTN